MILGYICTGTAFSDVIIEMCKSTGAAGRKPFFKVEMREAFITKVSQSATDEGNVVQKCEMVFKAIGIMYYQQGIGSLTYANEYSWDIAEGKAQAGGLPGSKLSR